MIDPEILAVIKDGGDLLTYLLVYVAWKQHENSKVILDHEFRLKAAGL